MSDQPGCRVRAPLLRAVEKAGKVTAWRFGRRARNRNDIGCVLIREDLDAGRAEREV